MGTAAELVASVVAAIAAVAVTAAGSQTAVAKLGSHLQRLIQTLRTSSPSQGFFFEDRPSLYSGPHRPFDIEMNEDPSDAGLSLRFVEQENARQELFQNVSLSAQDKQQM